MNFSDAILHGFARGDHGGAGGEPIATLDPILSKPVSPLATDAMIAALAQDPPPTVEQRVATLEARLAELEARLA